MRADGPTLGEIVRSMVTGRAISGYSLLSSGVSRALPDYEVLGIVGQALQESAIFSAGARVVPMDAPSVKLARVTSTPDIEIKPEADDRDLTDQAIGFTPVSMDANSAFLYGTTTLEAVEDVANLEETITGIFSRQLARAWDKAFALGGDGNGEPLGLGYMFAATASARSTPTPRLRSRATPSSSRRSAACGPSTTTPRPSSWTCRAGPPWRC